MYANFSNTPTPPLPSFIRGDFPRVTRKAVITGGNFGAGTVLGRITSSKKVTKSLAASSDGSEAVRFILAEDADASAGDVEAIVYLTGDFDPDGLTFGTGHNAASAIDALRDLSIFI